MVEVLGNANWLIGESGFWPVHKDLISLIGTYAPRNSDDSVFEFIWN